MILPSLTIERVTGEGGVSLVSLKIQTHHVELNVVMTPEELRTLRDIHAANWNERRALRAGTAASAPVFWCCDATSVTVLVGLDDESWGIAISLPPSFASNLIQVAEEA